MHRTVGVGTVYIKPAEVNGTKAKSLRTSPEMPRRRQKSRARKQSLLGSQFVYIGVLSDDFAAVDVREELCYHSRPKKQIQEVHGTGIKPMKESIARRKKRQPSPERFSGDGSAPPRFRFGFRCRPFRGVCLAAAGEARRTCLCQAHALVPKWVSDGKIVKNYFL